TTGVLSGTPVPPSLGSGSAGSGVYSSAFYPLIFIADNGIGAPDIQDFTLIVQPPPPLSVTSFTPAPSGFTATFNRAFDAAQLNLYNAAANGMGPADVTLKLGNK